MTTCPLQNIPRSRALDKISTTIGLKVFLLPNNIKEGDYIELGQLGAYSLTFRTNFNGFYSNEIHELSDKPIISMYDNAKDKVGSLVA